MLFNFFEYNIYIYILEIIEEEQQNDDELELVNLNFKKIQLMAEKEKLLETRNEVDLDDKISSHSSSSSISGSFKNSFFNSVGNRYSSYRKIDLSNDLKGKKRDFVLLINFFS